MTTVDGAVPNSALMPPIETGSALMFHDICAWPIAMAAIGNHEVRAAVWSPVVERLVMSTVPEVHRALPRDG